MKTYTLQCKSKRVNALTQEVTLTEKELRPLFKELLRPLWWELRLGVPVFDEECETYEIIHAMKGRIQDLCCKEARGKLIEVEFLDMVRKHYAKVRKQRDVVFDFLEEWREQRKEEQNL